jgi:uncharacterized membrane protein
MSAGSCGEGLIGSAASTAAASSVSTPLSSPKPEKDIPVASRAVLRGICSPPRLAVSNQLGAHVSMDVAAGAMERTCWSLVLVEGANCVPGATAYAVGGEPR